jgi:hypothetical protein
MMHPANLELCSPSYYKTSSRSLFFIFYSSFLDYSFFEAAVLPLRRDADDGASASGFLVIVGVFFRSVTIGSTDFFCSGFFYSTGSAGSIFATNSISFFSNLLSGLFYLVGAVFTESSLFCDSFYDFSLFCF